LTHEIYEDESFSDRSDDEIGDDETKRKFHFWLKMQESSFIEIIFSLTFEANKQCISINIIT